MHSAGDLLKEARRATGISQVELARRSGVAQPTISAYERGLHEPGLHTLQRLVNCTGLTLDIRLSDRTEPARLPSTPTGMLVRVRRHDLIAAGQRLGASNLRLFGSAARGDDRPGSDIDILVDLAPNVGLVGLGLIEEQFEQILEREVDVVPASALKDRIRERVLQEAIPLESA